MVEASFIEENVVQECAVLLGRPTLLRYHEGTIGGGMRALTELGQTAPSLLGQAVLGLRVPTGGSVALYSLQLAAQHLCSDFLLDVSQA